jgi:outer membrane lipoprotein-sorting protein
MSSISRLRAIVLFIAILPLTGCLWRSHKYKPTASTAPLKTATQAELIDYINGQAARVQSMNATVDIDTSVGGEKKGRVTDYQQIRGYVLARKPEMLRMIGLLPVVRTKAFDLVSDGKEFKLWIPPKNRFVQGRNDVKTPNPQQPLENLRPQHIYDALLIPGIDSQKDHAVMQGDVEQVVDPKNKKQTLEQADYEILVIHEGEHGWYVSRKIVFSRTDLLPHRQIVNDENGNQITDVRYGVYKEYSGVSFPSQIEIKRPQEEYDITLSMVKLDLNTPLTNDKFILEKPPGAEVVHLNDSKTQVRASKNHSGE